MASPRPPDFASFLARLSDALRGEGLGFMLIGGQAVLLHGRPRLTEDVDVTLDVGPEGLPRILGVLEALALNPLPDDVEDFVRETYVLPASDPETSLRVDFIFSTTPYERQAIRHADEVELEGVKVPFATAEDLVLHKLFAGRPRDLEDAEGVVRRKGDELDWDYLGQWAREFASIPGREDLPDRVASLRKRAGEGYS